MKWMRFHYLTKPLSAEKLTQVLSKAADKLSVEPPSVVISCDGETLKLYESDILYAEAFLHYIVIHTKTTSTRSRNLYLCLKIK